MSKILTEREASEKISALIEEAKAKMAEAYLLVRTYPNYDLAFAVNLSSEGLLSEAKEEGWKSSRSEDWSASYESSNY